MRIRCGNQTLMTWCETRGEVKSADCTRGKLKKIKQVESKLKHNMTIKN